MSVPAARQTKASSLAHYDEMCRAIEAAYAVDEVKDIRDQAIALEVYARQAHNTEAERKACEDDCDHDEGCSDQELPIPRRHHVVECDDRDHQQCCDYPGAAAVVFGEKVDGGGRGSFVQC
jgi:hypothetical protein